MSNFRKLLITLIGQLTVITSIFASSLPSGTVLYEAEEYFMKDGRFQVKDCIHTSATRFIGAKDKQATSPEECFLFQGDFPDNKFSYTVWACVRDLDLEIRSPMLAPVKFSGKGGAWHWISLGRYDAAQIGTTFSLYGVSAKNTFSTDAGLDTILLVPDKAFKPQGVFQGYSGKEDAVTESASSQKMQIEYKIDNLNPGKEISPFIASANAHGLTGHMLDNEEWDKVMFRLYGANMLAPLFQPRNNPKQGESDWDFEAIDKFLKRAKEQWKVREIMMFPQWWVKSQNGAPPTQEQLDAGARLLMELVKHYGTKENPLYVRYWVLNDEWPCGGYWKKNYREFAKYYARLVREVKNFNPELIVGGPVDCWPNDTITAELLKACPELDFIAWNMFITGRADTPLDTLFQRTSFIKTCLRASRELGKRYHKKELPIFITSLGPNYHAWDPLDLRMSDPVMGVWHALAVNYMAEEGCAAGLFYNVRAKDCGFFGPSDWLASRSGMQPAKPESRMINLRPSGRIVEFYKKYLTGKRILPITTAASSSEKLNLLAAMDNNGETLISIVNFSATPRQVKIKFKSFEMEAYGSTTLPSKFIYCDQNVITTGEGFFFRADGTAYLTLPQYSTWVIVTKNRINPETLKAREDQQKRYHEQAAVFHMDGNLEDAAGSGSKSLGWYGEHFSETLFKCGKGSGNYTGDLHNRARIRLEGRAASLNNSKAFGIAFWVYRVKNTADYGSILSFGTGKFMIEHVGGGNPDSRFQLKNPGFCNFGGTWKHSLIIPSEEWTHVAITADGEYGRIIVNGQTKWKFTQTGNGLNGSDTLYLGSQQGDTGPIDCYIDELILCDKPTGEKWADNIFTRTRNGQNY